MKLLEHLFLSCGVLMIGGCMVSSQNESDAINTVEPVAVVTVTYPEDISIASPEDWLSWNPTTGSFDITDGVFQVKGKAISLYSKEMLKIDPNKAVRIAGNFKNISSAENTTVYLGFQIYDENQKEIRDWAVRVVSNSDTVLSRKCHEESTTIYIRDASNWKEGAKVIPVFFTENDYSDLPNDHLKRSYSQSIKSVTKLTDNNFAVEFAEPVGFDAENGTGIRLHGQGGTLMYAGGSKTLKPQESVTLSGIVQGQATMGMPADAWCPGAAYARLIVLVRSNSEDCKVQFDSIEAETLTENTL